MSESSQAGSPRQTAELRRIWGDLLQMFELRRQLAEAEIRSDLTAARRLALVGGCSATLVLTGLPLLLLAAALGLDGQWGLSTLGWCLAIGLTALVLGLAAGWAAWRRFRQDFQGLHQSLAEMKEDLIWLRERLTDV